MTVLRISILLVCTLTFFSCQEKKVKSRKSDQKNTFELLSHVNGLMVGVSTFKDVKQVLGLPDKITKNSSGGPYIEYSDLGIGVIFFKGDLSNDLLVIEGFYLDAPFDGVSKEGIFVGMDAQKCLEIMNNKFYLRSNAGRLGYVTSKYEQMHDKAPRIWIDFTKKNMEYDPNNYTHLDKVKSISIYADY